MLRVIKGIKILPIIIISSVLLGVGCMGTNPADAPFGSTVSFLNPPGDFGIPPNTQVLIDVSALVIDPEGFPLNDIKVLWTMSFGGINDLVYDTDGDGIADSRAVQFVDPDECQEVELDCSLVDSKFYAAFGALKDSPVQKLTNNLGISRMLILGFGDFTVDPASLQVNIASDFVSEEFSITN